MDIILLLKSAIMGVVEGLTEFLPISSTGHLILTGHLIGGFDDARAHVFEIAIQTGAILAVIGIYWQRMQQTVTTLHSSAVSRKFTWNVLIGFLPAVIVGLLFGDAITTYLFTPLVVALAFIIGGFIIIWAEKKPPVQATVHNIDDMTWWNALKVGLIQVTAFIPGTSRSGATIIGGMLTGLDRQTSTDYSFYLAIPTLVGATVYAMVKDWAALNASDIPMFAVGFVFAFISAWLCVKWLLGFVSRSDFIPFAWYRIAFGIFILITAYSGVINWQA